MTTKQLDWNAQEARARDMTVEALLGALRDVRDTLEAADALDRAYGGTLGGFYRDEASVYHRELVRRGVRP